MKLVIFTLFEDGSPVGINPEQVCAVVPFKASTDIVTTARALTYRVAEPIGSVVHRLQTGADLDFAEEVEEEVEE